MWQSYLLLFSASLMPVLGAALLFSLDKFTRFNKLNFWIKQTIYGVVFGLLAVAGTHCGIPFYGAQSNVRDASVIVAGLVFGWPAGLIAGGIAALERFAGVYWFGLGSATVTACCVATAFAGVASALLNRFMYERKRAGAISGVFLTVVIEIFHLLLVFVTNAKDYKNAYNIVNACTAPMLIGNCIGVLLSILVVKIIDLKKDAFKRPDVNNLTNKMQVRLGSLICVAFVLSTVFIYFFQNEITTKQTTNDLDKGILDTESGINDKASNNMLSITGTIILSYESDPSSFSATSVANTLGIAEVNVIDGSGYIIDSNIKENVGYNMSRGDEQALEFEPIWTHSDPEFSEYVQVGGPISRDKSIWRKYAAISFTSRDGCLQIGYSKEELEEELEEELKDITEFTSIGDRGGIIVLDAHKNIVSKKYDFDETAARAVIGDVMRGDTFKTYEGIIAGEKYYLRYDTAEAYSIITYIPESEANLPRNISVYVYTFLEVVIFGLVFVLVFFLNKKIVNNRLDKINASLDKITKGELDEVVERSSTTEFAELSDGINSTVDALKGYIEEAEKRIDAELAFAKSIQANALPSVFPDRSDVDLYAFMKTAKEVGGDFYDFYFTHTYTINFTIADVSGKGIPAALFMMKSKTELKSLTEMEMPLDKVFVNANNTLCDGNEAGMFVTTWQAKVDLRTGIMYFVNAGHNPPLVKHANGKFEYLHSKANLVLGMMKDMPYVINEYQLDEGDIVFLYTDGVTESVNNELEQYGEKRLQDALNSNNFATNEERCKFIYEDVVKFCEGADQFDDITMVAFTFKERHVKK